MPSCGVVASLRAASNLTVGEHDGELRRAGRLLVEAEQDVFLRLGARRARHLAGLRLLVDTQRPDVGKLIRRDASDAVGCLDWLGRDKDHAVAVLGGALFHVLFREQLGRLFLGAGRRVAEAAGHRRELACGLGVHAQGLLDGAAAVGSQLDTGQRGDAARGEGRQQQQARKTDQSTHESHSVGTRVSHELTIPETARSVSRESCGWPAGRFRARLRWDRESAATGAGGPGGRVVRFARALRRPPASPARRRRPVR